MKDKLHSVWWASEKRLNTVRKLEQLSIASRVYEIKKNMQVHMFFDMRLLDPKSPLMETP